MAQAREGVTANDLRKWIFENYTTYMKDGGVNRAAVMVGLIEEFGGRPNPQLEEFVDNVLFDIQQLAQQKVK